MELFLKTVIHLGTKYCHKHSAVLMRGTILINTAKRDKVAVDTVSKKSLNINLFNELLSKSNITYQIITRLTEIFDYHWSVAAFFGQIFLCVDLYNVTNFLVTFLNTLSVFDCTFSLPYL